MRLLIVFAGVVACLVAKGQSTTSFNVGVGTFKMEEMKNFQEDYASTLAVDAETVSSFPAYTVYELGAQWLRPRNFVIGASIAWGSTGGRVYYSDYSGSVGSDQLLSYTSYGAIFGAQKSFFDGLVILQGDVRPALSTTIMKLKNFYHTAATSYENNGRYESQNVTLQPTATAFLRYKFIGINAQVGYNAPIYKGKFWYEEGTSSSGQLDQGVVANWSGLRVSGGVSLFLGPSEPKEQEYDDLVTVALGAGFDYGGFGVNLQTYPTKQLGLFAGFGYALAGIGYNGGMKLRIVNKPETRWYGYFLAMYGYNGAVTVHGASEHNRIFYGPTAGFGIESNPDEYGTGQWSFALLVPIRGDDYENYITSLKAYGIDFGQRWRLPVNISVGYRLVNTRRDEPDFSGRR